MGTERLSVPIGRNLADTSNRTLVPTTGALSYDNDSELLYYGTTSQWLQVGSGVQGTTGPTGISGSASATGLDGKTEHTGMGCTGPTGIDGQTCKDLIANNKDGKAETIFYNHIPILLLKEIQRSNKIIDELRNTVTSLFSRNAFLENK